MFLHDLALFHWREKEDWLQAFDGSIIPIFVTPQMPIGF